MPPKLGQGIRDLRTAAAGANVIEARILKFFDDLEAGRVEVELKVQLKLCRPPLRAPLSGRG